MSVTNNFLDPLNQDEQQYEQIVEQQKSDMELYAEKLAALSKIGNPEQAFLALVLLLSGGGFDTLNDGLGSQGAALKNISDLANITNTLQKYISPSAQDPNAKNPQNLVDFAKGLDQILDILDPNSQSPAAQLLRESVNPETTSTLYSQFLAIRQTIRLPGDNPAYNPQSGAPVYFDPTSKNPPIFSNFADWQTALKTPGNSAAQSALTLFNGSFQTAQATTQSSTSATNTNINAETNTMKSLQSFLSAMMNAILSVTKTAEQNYAKG